MQKLVWSARAHLATLGVRWQTFCQKRRSHYRLHVTTVADGLQAGDALLYIVVVLLKAVNVATARQCRNECDVLRTAEGPWATEDLTTIDESVFSVSAFGGLERRRLSRMSGSGIWQEGSAL